MVKKYISLAAAVLLMFQLVSISPAAASETVAFEQNAQLLRALEVTVNAEAEDGLTRGDFIAAIVQLMGLSYYGDVAVFNDLTTGHRQYQSVMAASAENLVFGDEQGEIAADRPITLAEAEIITLRALGYGPMLCAGMPVQSALVSSGILKGVRGETPITWESAASMLVNAAEANLVEQTMFGVEGKYGNTGETLLSRYRNIYKVNGVLDGTEITRLTVSEGLSAGMISIDGVRYRIGYTNTVGLLGYAVTAYFEQDRNDTKDRLLLYIVPERRNEVVTIQADDICSYDNREFVYEEEGKRKRISFDRNADVIYNNAPLLEITKENLSIQTGTVTLIDHDGNGNCEVVLVNEFDTYVVESVSASEDKLVTKYPSGVMDFGSAERTVIVQNQRGEAIDISELSEWDVLCVFVSKDGEKLTIIYSPTEVEGEITSITEAEDGRQIITIDGRELKASRFFQTANQANVQAGEFSLFYLDINGDIAAYNDRFRNRRAFGYAVKMIRENGLDGTVKLKLLTQNNTMEAFSLKKSVLIDGVKYKSADEAYEALGGASFTPQLVCYGASKENEIHYLDTEQMGNESGDTLEMYYTGYVCDNGVHSEKQQLSYRSSTKVFGGKISMTDSTVLMTVPRSAEGAADEDYNVRPLSWLQNEKDYSVEAYKTVKAAHNADVILVYVNTGGGVVAGLSDERAVISVIDKVTEALDEQGEEQYQVYFYRDGRFHKAMTKNKEVLDSVKVRGAAWKPGCGDVVRLEINDGKILYCELDYVRSTDTMVISNPSNAAFAAVPRFQLAYAYEKEGGNLWTTRNKLTPGTSYAFDFSGNDLENRPVSPYNMVVYDEKKNRLRAGTIDDITAFTNTGNQMCSRLFIDDRYGNPRTLVIYNDK